MVTLIVITESQPRYEIMVSLYVPEAVTVLFFGGKSVFNALAYTEF